jgi:K+-transporting ATPase A subunit
MKAQARLQIALTLLIAVAISVPAGRYLGRVLMDRTTRW